MPTKKPRIVVLLLNDAGETIDELVPLHVAADMTGTSRAAVTAFLNYHKVSRYYLTAKCALAPVKEIEALNVDYDSGKVSGRPRGKRDRP